jgi:hypothetical protein
MAFLLTHRPDAAQIVGWLSDPRELDRLLSGTAYAVMIDRSAGPQRWRLGLPKYGDPIGRRELSCSVERPGARRSRITGSDRFDDRRAPPAEGF